MSEKESPLNYTELETELRECLAYFVAWHTEGELPREFSGGQFRDRLAKARELVK